MDQKHIAENKAKYAANAENRSNKHPIETRDEELALTLKTRDEKP